MTKEFISEAMQRLQDRICARIEMIDGGEKFKEDLWSREEGGGGRTRIMRGGTVIEKGGINFSEVFGEVTPMMKQNTEIKGDHFFATGVSIVLHPQNAHVPIIHMNVRYFETDEGTYWFGGGIDLTPHYVTEELARKFHNGLKGVCDKYHSNFYPKFKTWADDYFFIPHRNETRGIGGIFFDHQKETDEISKEELLNFCIDLGDAFAALYNDQVTAGHHKEMTADQKAWMNIRRGRYVEFNLVHDRGTKFGLYSGGRTESILMSLPNDANWEYSFVPEVGSPEAQTLSYLNKGIDWLA